MALSKKSSLCLNPYVIFSILFLFLLFHVFHHRSNLVSSLCESNLTFKVKFDGLSEYDVFYSDEKLKRSQFDPQLLQYIRKHHLYEPSTKELNLTYSGQSVKEETIYHSPRKVFDEVWALLNQQENGFFVEAGANNGIFLSNSLTLEKDHGWTGLLAEGNPRYEMDVLSHNRRAWFSNVCLSVNQYPEVVKMYDSGAVSRIIPESDAKSKVVYTKCIPIGSILGAIGVKHVDYLALDVEGVEAGILSTFDFSHFTFKVITAECSKESLIQLKEILEPKGYAYIKTIYKNA